LDTAAGDVGSGPAFTDVIDDDDDDDDVVRDDGDEVSPRSASTSPYWNVTDRTRRREIITV